MESLNLNTLVSSLPTAQQNAEKELLNNFKGATLHSSPDDLQSLITFFEQQPRR